MGGGGGGGVVLFGFLVNLCKNGDGRSVTWGGRGVGVGINVGGVVEALFPFPHLQIFYM